MPVSSHEGKSWLEEKAAHLSPMTVLDVGPGEGVYAMRMRPFLPISRWTGVEIWEPYVAKFDLESKYSEIVVGDIRTCGILSRQIWDLIIFGDVIEHMSKDDAVRVLRLAARHSLAVAVSVPVVHMPQGEYDGNPFEAHLYHWTSDEMLATLTELGGIVSYSVCNNIGVFWVTTPVMLGD